ncbi:hypothetical protein AUC71_07755 [Methyloceanibacter marginalis]|uniref:Uncharacterized protein n=1 Tax=Methyloceanibacter marginalis TaxID=1774971 RepID=A0A1E3WDD5_9HYPH|nr:hypothetical protein [Methyloceanibacter marginalis]ODS03791.1 hypothetical protein AUC71_07755 [Methyloceanibacter marginalis]
MTRPTTPQRQIAAILDALAQGDRVGFRRLGGQAKGRINRADRLKGVEHWLSTSGDRHPVLAAALRQVLGEIMFRERTEPEPAVIKTRCTFRDLMRQQAAVAYAASPEGQYAGRPRWQRV